MENINIICINMEYGIHEQVIKNQDDTYTILLNARDSHETRMVSYSHALKHINNKDFEKSNVQQIEADCHRQ